MKALFVRVVLASLFLGTSSSHAALGNASDQLLEQILRDWKARQESTLTVRYQLEGTGTVVKGSVQGIVQNPELAGEGTLPPEDYTYPGSLVYKIDFVKGLVRRERGAEIYDVTTKKFARQYSVHVFDGKTHTAHHPKEKNEPPPGSLLSDVALDAPADFRFEFQDLPVFLAHGTIPAAQMPTLSKLKPAVDATSFRVVGKGMVRQAECIVLKSGKDSRHVQYWVDPRKQSAVVRVETYSGENLVSRLDVDYKEIEWGHVPSGWTVNHFFGGQPTQMASFSVSNCAVNEPLEAGSFEIDLRPGMVVQKGKMEFFTVSDVGELEPYRRKDGSGSRIRLTLLLVAAVVALIVAGVVLYKKLARGKA